MPDAHASADPRLLAGRDYRLIFAAAQLTTLAAAISGLALPLTAVTHLGASSMEMALLAAAELLPFALFSLPAGAWIDRSRKKWIGIAFNLLAAAASMIVPLVFTLGTLSLNFLYGLGFVIGGCAVIGGSAVQVHLTQVVGRDRLLEATAQMTAANSGISIVGPAFAALLMAHFDTPLTVTASALLFAGGALVLWRIRRDDPPPAHPRAHWWPDALDGLRLIRTTPMLRALALFGALWLMLLGGFGAQFVLFTTRDLGLSATDLALISSFGAAGALAGSIAARRFERRRGARSVMLAGFLLSAIGMGLYPLATSMGQTPLAHGTLMFAACVKLFTDFAITLYTVNYISLRHRITPDAMLGRVTTSMRGIGVSAAPVGALAWGVVAERAGIAPAMLLISAAGILLWLAARRYMPQPRAFDVQST